MLYHLSTNILSLSVAIPTSSRPIFSILDFIPTAESKISDSIISSFPLDLTDAKTLFFFFSTEITSDEVMIFMPFFLNDFSNSLETSTSSKGTIFGMYSITVTSLPMLL